MRKKILWVSHFLPFPPKGGAQMRSFNLIKQLSQYHDVSIFCLVHEDVVINYFDSLDSAIIASRGEFDKFCVDSLFVPIKRNSSKKLAYIKSLFSGKSYSVSRLNIKFVGEKLKEFIEGKSFDSVHLDTVSLSLLSNIFDEQKIVLNHHNIESVMMYRRAQEKNNLLMKFVCYLDAWKIKNLERKACSVISTHIVCSDLDADRLADLFPGVTTTTIPNGIDCSTVIEKRNSDRKSLLFIGGLDWYPNADAINFLLTQVWPKVNERNPLLCLDIIGKNPSSGIKELAGKYSNVRLHGFVNDIAPYYESAWLYICPIKDGGGTKLKVLDAMANGVPLIAHPVAMEGIDAIPGEHYYQASTALDFVNTIFDLYSKSSEVSEKIGANGKELIISKYDYKSIGEKLANIYG